MLLGLDDVTWALHAAGKQDPCQHFTCKCALKYTLGEAKTEWELIGQSPADLAEIMGGRHTFTFQRRLTYEELRPVIMSPDLQLKQVALCYAQCRTVSLEAGDTHVAGSPCTDFSLMRRQKRLGGPTAAALLAWIRWVRYAQPAVAVHENVRVFPGLVVLGNLLGDLYALDAAIVGPSDFGWPVARPRRYTVLLHRGRVALQRPIADAPEAKHKRSKLSGTVVL